MKSILNVCVLDIRSGSTGLQSERLTNYSLNILLTEFVAAGSPKRQTNPNKLPKRRLIIQEVIIQCEVQVRGGNAGHFHWQEKQVEHFKVDALILYTDSSFF